VTQGSSHLKARAYAILHLMHHAFTDTEKDPQTPHFFKEIFTMMMHTKKVYNSVLNSTLEVEKRWAGHKYGYRNFPGEKEQSKNTLFIDFLMLGELFQNNHHHAGAIPKFAAKWWEIDPVYPVIKLFNKIGIIKLIPLKY
jgi:fatty-acid desaturase